MGTGDIAADVYRGGSSGCPKLHNQKARLRTSGLLRSTTPSHLLPTALRYILFSQGPNLTTSKDEREYSIFYHFLSSDLYTKPQSRCVSGGEGGYADKGLSNEHVSQTQAVLEWPSLLWGTLLLPETYFPRLLSHLQRRAPPAPLLTPAKLPRHHCYLPTVNRSKLVREFTKYASLIKPYLHEKSSYTVHGHSLFLCNMSSFWAWGCPAHLPALTLNH